MLVASCSLRNGSNLGSATVDFWSSNFSGLFVCRLSVWHDLKIYIFKCTYRAAHEQQQRKQHKQHNTTQQLQAQTNKLGAQTASLAQPTIQCLSMEANWISSNRILFSLLSANSQIVHFIIHSFVHWSILAIWGEKNFINGSIFNWNLHHQILAEP